MERSLGKEMYGWISNLFPINRSLMGEGVRETLKYLQGIVPELKIKDVPTGYRAFDWEVPKEWNLQEAYLEDENRKRIVDIKNSNLHVIGYSAPVDEWFSLADLQDHLFSLPEQPEAIPYVTSYYQERWGFCLSHNERLSLKEGKYHAVIRSALADGVLNYGELVIPGSGNEEIFFSTYVCHPSMANNELSGPSVSIALARWLAAQEHRKYTYRFVFIPETIGSLVYLSLNLEELKEKVYAGFNITCVGDSRCYSYVPSRMGNTISDQVALHVLKNTDLNFKRYTWLDRGSDERQYCAPYIDLPVATITRSKYEEYPEYHTSLDNLDFIDPEGLAGSFDVYRKCVEILERNKNYKVTVLGEPQLGKRGLYPSLSKKDSVADIKKIRNFISYCDGKHSLVEIAEKIGVPAWELFELIEILSDHKLLE